MSISGRRWALILTALTALAVLAVAVVALQNGRDPAYVTEPRPTLPPSPSPTPPDSSPSPEASTGAPSPVPSAGVPATATPSRRPSPTSVPTRATAGRNVLFRDGFSGTGELTREDNGTHPFWWVEPGSGPFVSTGSTLKRTNNTEFDRMLSRKRFGGPGKTVRYRYRARMTALYPDGGWPGFRGIKTGMKFPADCGPYAKTDPRSAYGGPAGVPEKCWPDSYIAVDGIMEDGRYEIATSDYGGEGYTFIGGPKRPYSVGTWVEKTVEISWIGDGDVRFRFWNNATGSGKPVWEATDTSSPFDEPGYLWWRLDYADAEWDYFLVEEEPSRRD